MQYLFGIIGIILIQGSYLPQIWRTYQTKDVKGLSGKFILMVFLGCASYLGYAIQIRDPIYIIANSMSMVLTACLLFMIRRYKKTEEETSA